jgi:hypothetical protein
MLVDGGPMTALARDPAWDKRFLVQTGVLSSRVDEELVLLHCELGQYFGLDEVGAFIFERVAAGDTLGHVHKSLLETFDADSPGTWCDLVAFVDDMVRRQILTESPG